jgi:hypothetical protein
LSTKEEDRCNGVIRELYEGAVRMTGKEGEGKGELDGRTRLGEVATRQSDRLADLLLASLAARRLARLPLCAPATVEDAWSAFPSISETIAAAERQPAWRPHLAACTPFKTSDILPSRVILPSSSSLVSCLAPTRRPPVGPASRAEDRLAKVDGFMSDRCRLLVLIHCVVPAAVEVEAAG